MAKRQQPGDGYMSDANNQQQHGKHTAGSVPGKLPSDATGGGNPGYYQHLLSKVHLGVIEAANASDMKPPQHDNLQYCETS